jgi:glyoxylase-like metal-dependent hydrolase (beta-lactamase superfamily II)
MDSDAKAATPTRRQLLLAGGGLALALGPIALADRARASAVQTFKHGGHEVSVISDGHLLLPRAMVAQGNAEIEAAMAAAGQTGERIQSPTNVTLIRSGGELILVDVGSGKNFMETAGRLADNLQSAGIDATKVTKVVYTHAHPDHIWGTLDDFDDPRFANASHWISEQEWNFWMSPDVLTRLPEDRHSFAAGAKRQLTGVKDKIKTFKPGDDIAPGIRAIDTGGHTQGHVSIEIAAPSGPLIVLGDALTHPIVSFAYPQWKPVSDHEPDRAVATRKALLDRLAAEKARIIGYHLPFPGHGMVERAGGAFRFVPVSA